ncbi:histidinol-phosphate transaminase [Thermodesulfovibrio thiophilus]|uniref:histidinol-phosphate transaminase n=1 Tax=Thermodesulfovibrio thiophilus TaxID=340095 RepID=UPI0017A60F41|nr:histidinol-phosphate transaminase [Thermodesulfovibrio thiophilus]HHW20232.1 histidinol-phosphate transaminase [Thermodesulfovibrio thiophilus]
MIKPLSYVEKIQPYIPGKPIKEVEREIGIKGCIKLASNENPVGPSPEVINAIKDFLSKPVELGRYPEGSGYELKNALCELFLKKGIQLSHDEIILGNGSNELLDIAVRTYIGPGDEAIMAQPSFVVYSMSVIAQGGIACEVPLKDYRHNLEEMLKKVTDKTKIIFIANPNNPTGTINYKKEFGEFMKAIPDNILVIIDEAYYEYVREPDYPDSLEYFKDGRDILILRTFSKAYGLASLRIGYGIAKKEIITEINKIRQPFNTNTIAQIAAEIAVKDDEHLKKVIEINENGKKYLYSELDKISEIKYIPTQTNFIYIILPDKMSSKEVFDTLLIQGVIVRPVGPAEIRVTIGLPDENKAFISAFKKIFGG